MKNYTWSKLGIVGLLIAVIAGMTFFVVSYSDKVDQQIKYVDAAGRQRMLSQKIAFFASTLNNSEERKKTLHDLVMVHDSTLSVFMSGGAVPGFDFDLDPTTDESIRAFVITDLLPLWESYKSDVESISNQSMVLTSNKQDQLNDKAERILALNHQLVKLYRKASIQSKEEFKIVVIILLLVLFFFGMIVVFFVFKFLTERNLLSISKNRLVVNQKELVQKNNELTASEEELRAQQEELTVLIESQSENQKALLKEKEVSEIIQDVSKVGYWEMKIPSMESYSTAEVAALYGIEQGTILDFDESMEYFPESVREKVEKAFNNAVTKKEPYDLIVPFFKAKKEQVWVRAVGRVATDENGNVNRLYGTFQDVTQQKKQDEILQKNKELERSIAFKSDFLAQMSHEIRTPLNGIIGSLETIEGSEEKDKDKLMDVMKDSSFELLHIVNNVLKLSKLEAGQEESTNAPFNVESMCQGVIQLFDSKAKEKGLALDFSIDANVSESLSADEPRLKQVLNNLISNALKFTSEGKVHLGVEKVDASNLKFSVSDTGFGIKKEEVERIFSKYGQSKDVEQGKQDGQLRGTGLGLVICNMLVELMGGSAINVESEYGKGSVFSFTLPYIPVKSKVEETEIEKEAKVVQFDMNILLVEDIKANQIVGSMMMQSLGCKVEIANNGQEALDKYSANQGKYDIILMDIQMPVMDGLTATHELKKRFKDMCPIIALSANAMEGDSEKYIGLGLDDYIPKPITKDLIVSKLSKWVN